MGRRRHSWTPTALGYTLPADPTYWDCNVDGFADDACVRGYKAGAGWGGSADARFSEAFSQWSANTDFDPVASTSGQAVYKDDRNVPCLGSWADYPSVLGIVCISKQWRLDSYYRIVATPTYMNPNRAWWYGAAQGPADRPDFRGALTHELGPWIYLGHVAGKNGANYVYP